MPRLARTAVHHRIAKGILVSTCLPDRSIHDNRAVHADHILAFANISAPPEIFEIAFELDSQRPVIPKAIQPSINFRGLENKATAFAEADDLFHALIRGGIFRHERTSYRVKEQTRAVRRLPQPLAALRFPTRNPKLHAGMRALPIVTRPT